MQFFCEFFSSRNEMRMNQLKEEKNTYFDTSQNTTPKSDGPYYYNKNTGTFEGI